MIKSAITSTSELGNDHILCHIYLGMIPANDSPGGHSLTRALCFICRTQGSHAASFVASLSRKPGAHLVSATALR